MFEYSSVVWILLLEYYEYDVVVLLTTSTIGTRVVMSTS